MARSASLRTTTSADYLEKLNQACQWLSVDQGRAARYRQLIGEFIQNDSRSREHILSISESQEIVDLFELWAQRVADFPGLEDKLKTVFRKGPVLREGETLSASSNKARNDAFTFLVAGTLLKSGIPVVAVEGRVHVDKTIDSIADLTMQSGDRAIDVECKRPQSKKALLKRAEEARDQITHSKRNGRHGIVALDCSVIVRPAGRLLESSGHDNAESSISMRLEGLVETVTPCLTNSILGYVFFARVPAMTRLPIVTSREAPIFRPDSICSWLVVSNSGYPNPSVLASLAKKIAASVNPRAPRQFDV